MFSRKVKEDINDNKEDEETDGGTDTDSDRQRGKEIDRHLTH